MQTEAYLKRINYQGDLTPNFEVLQALQKAHLLNVPFENLDIHYGNPIELDLHKIYPKIVVNNRGGFCYELNGLFHSLLQTLGYNAKMVSARVYHAKKDVFGQEYDHLVIIVELNQVEYLVDVGFGEFTFQPLKFELGSLQSDPKGDFMIEAHENDYFKVSRIGKETKSIAYIFTKQERVLNDFAGMCTYHQTDPNSHFTQGRLISKALNNGRITIAGNELKITEGKITKQEQQLTEDEFRTQLLKWFDLDELTIKMGD